LHRQSGIYVAGNPLSWASKTSISSISKNRIYREAEAGHERRFGDLFRDLPLKLDVKNEARVHLWYKERFGYTIKPYSSSADAIATFPTTATSVGIRRLLGNFECCAPFGLDDLFGLIVRPNKRQVTGSIYEMKTDRWRLI
jgi:hypothetical protein